MEKKKKYLILGIIILLALGGVTVAYLTWSSENINIGLNSDCFTIDYTKGGDINNASVKLMNESDLIDSNNKFTIKEGIALTYANIGIKSTCGIEGYGSLYLNITSLSDAFAKENNAPKTRSAPSTGGHSVGALKYAILKNTSTSTVSVTNLLNQSFDIIDKGAITSTGTKKILTKQLSNTEVNKYIIVIYIDKALADNDAIGASFTGKISADANQGMKPSAASEIINLYKNASKEEVTNNSITYNKAPSVNLMNDRLGGTTTSLDGGNIRYYGASPNNYIYFNCSDYSNQSSSTCEVWRIIGVFDGKIKLINNRTVKEGFWNSTSSNDWSGATVNTYLNGDYYNSLVNDATRNIITETIWNLGGFSSSSIYSNVAYTSERGTEKCSDCTYDTTWIGKIALPYLSDYGYASEFGTDYCNETLENYNTDYFCWNRNWMPKSRGSEIKTGVISSNTTSSLRIWTFDLYYRISNSSVNNIKIAYIPTLYLNSDVELKGGDGTGNYPYQLDA